MANIMKCLKVFLLSLIADSFCILVLCVCVTVFLCCGLLYLGCSVKDHRPGSHTHPHALSRSSVMIITHFVSLHSDMRDDKFLNPYGVKDSEKETLK